VSVPRPPILVVEEALVSLRACADAAAPFETGGLIVGVTTTDSIWITSFVEIQGIMRHRSRFVIPAGVTHPTIDALRRQDRRLGYLGDWHTHPADVGPSCVDFKTFLDLAIGSFGHRRIFGLVRRRGNTWDTGLWAMNRFRLPVRSDYAMTGPLSPA
jgi:integrative and conjugative element protein (TIGR02256 family)